MRWRTTITMLLLILLVVGAGWYGYNQLVAPADPTDNSSRCTEKQIAKDGQLRAGEVTVNVYNAGDLSGLAGKTLSTFQRRGFRPGVSENAPGRLKVRKAVIYGSKANQADVRLVRKQFRDKVRVVRRPNLAEGVDVVVGTQFGGISRKAPTSLKIKAKKNACKKSAGRR